MLPLGKSIYFHNDKKYKETSDAHYVQIVLVGAASTLSNKPRSLTLKPIVNMIPLRHVPGLFLATTFTFGGLWPFWRPQDATREFGLPDRIATSKEANAVFTIYSSRMTTMGFMLYIFYYKRMFSSIDILLLTLGWAGVVDGIVCWREGVPGRAIFRAASGAVIAVMGGLGITAGA